MADSVKAPQTSHLPIVTPKATHGAGGAQSFAAMQRQLEANWDEPLEMPSYSPVMANRAAANLLGLSSPTETGTDTAQTHHASQSQTASSESPSVVQPQSLPGQPAIPDITLMRQGTGTAAEASEEVEERIQRSRGQGQPLGGSVRAPMEQAFGADFSSVRIHTDGESNELNQVVQAKAFTTGQDIYFRGGAYEPGSRGGQELLAHELTHVVQQGGAGSQLQRECGVDECCAEETTPEADGQTPAGMTSPDAPMSTTAPVSEDSLQSHTTEPQAGMTSADAPMSVPVPVVTSESEDNEFDNLVQAELEGFFEEFSAIPVTVRWVEQTDTQCVPRTEEVAVHPPYFMNVTQGSRSTAAARTVERYDAATGNRGDADRDTRRYLREVRTREDRGGMGMPSALVGKSSPEEIQTILQTAIDRNLIPTPAGQEHLTGADLRNWLVQYGIGVDCSAFVAQALNRVMEQVYDSPLTDDETLRRSGRGTRNARSMTGDARGFSEVEADEVRPGDTMGIPGHIRIVTSVRQDDEGNTIFTTAEARAGGQADVGPDRAEWRYRNGQLQMRRSPEADWSDTDEAPTFGRYDRLADAEEAQVAEETTSTEASIPQASAESTTEITIHRKEANSIAASEIIQRREVCDASGACWSEAGPDESFYSEGSNASYSTDVGTLTEPTQAQNEDPSKPVFDLYKGKSVNKIGHVSAPAGQYDIAKSSGVNVRAKPDGTLPHIAKVLYDTEVQVQALDNTSAFYFIIANTGAIGWINKDFVALDPPDVESNLHHITESNLTTILKNEYVDKGLWNLSTGNDYTTLAAAVVVANEGRKGVSVDWNKAQKYKSENTFKRVFDPWMIDNFAIYHGSTILKGHNIWLPSPSYVRLLQSSGVIGSRPGWINAAVDIGKGIAGFSTGIVSGVFGSLWDTLTGLWELGKSIVSTVKGALDGSLFASIKSIYDAVTNMTWEDFKDMVDEVITMGKNAFTSFMEKWEHPDTYKKWHFRGYTIGAIALEVVLAIFTGGGTLGVKVLAKIGKYFPKLMGVLNKLLKVADDLDFRRRRGKGRSDKSKDRDDDRDRDKDDENMRNDDRAWEQARMMAALITEEHDVIDTPVEELLPKLNMAIAAKSVF